MLSISRYWACPGWTWFTVCAMASLSARLMMASAVPWITSTGSFTLCQTSPRFKACNCWMLGNDLAGLHALDQVQRVELNKGLDRGVNLGRRFAFFCQAAALHFQDRKSTRLNSSHLGISYAVFC